jgi:MoaA/NifB/PqqE/SkfB family radical SAM enzyme
MMQDVIEELKSKYSIVGIVDLGSWSKEHYAQNKNWVKNSLKRLRKDRFENNERILFLYTSDVQVKGTEIGLALAKLQVLLNEVDISNNFVIVLSNRPIHEPEIARLKSISTDLENIEFIFAEDGEFSMTELDQYPIDKDEIYQYGSFDPIKISLNEIDHRQRYLLTESKTFCMYPWMHLHAWPTGQAFPCCHSETVGQVGNTNLQPLDEIWNSDGMKSLRLDMLNDRPNPACVRCYELEDSGFFSGRRSANKHHGHHIRWATETKDDGSVDRFNLIYWDIRFSNLCNLRCRSCGHIFSSSWYQDQTKLAGPDWAKKHKPLFWAGRHETDLWEQLLPHLDYVEQIYFAGGEPLMMDEHYRILEELERRGRFNVTLIYNTNFSNVKLKDRVVFDYWKRFDSVAVGASLDAMGTRAEYIRKGTDWDQIERNRHQMLEICPKVDFYLSATLSIMNAWHLPDFHRDWTERGLIQAQDFNVNLLQDPYHYRIDIAPMKYKQRLRVKFEEHLEWLRPRDRLTRATVGFESSINFLMATDNTKLLETFWKTTNQLDDMRGENWRDALPELEALL